MITQLTARQKKQIPEYIKKYISKATEPMNHTIAIDAIDKLYKTMGKDKPIIIFGTSPYNTILLNVLYEMLCETCKTEKSKESNDQLESELYGQLRRQIARQLDRQLHGQLRSQIDSQLHSQLRSQIDSQLYSQLVSQIDSQLYSQLESQFESQLERQLGSKLYSQLESELDSQLESELYGQLRRQIGSQLRRQLISPLESQLRSQIDSQLYNQNHSQLESQLERQLYGQLRSQLRSQIESQLENQIDSQLYSQLFSPLYSQLESPLERQLGSQLHSQLENPLYSQLESQLHSQLESELYGQLRSQIDSQLENPLYSQLESQLESQLYGQIESQLGKIKFNWSFLVWWLSWSAYFAFAKYIGVQFDNEKYELFTNFVDQVSFCIPYEKVCFVSEKPVDIFWKDGLLHKDGGASVQYSDGYSLYHLNGIKVPEYLALTPAGNLDLEFFKKEKNADVKAEFIRKYGIERLLKEGKLIDSYKNYQDEWWYRSEYELWDLKSLFEDITRHKNCYFLRMRNLTTGVWHVEGLDPKCDTLKKAISWRETQKENYDYETLFIT